MTYKNYKVDVNLTLEIEATDPIQAGYRINELIYDKLGVKTILVKARPQ